MDFWRSVLISRKDEIKNVIIKNKMNAINNIIDYVKQKQLEWYVHVKKMQEERLPRKVLEWIPSERRKGEDLGYRGLRQRREGRE